MEQSGISETGYRKLGTYLTVDMYGVENHILLNNKKLQKAITDSLVENDIIIQVFDSHEFQPHGFSFAAILGGGSTLTLHTWPGHKFTSMTIYEKENDMISEVMFLSLRNKLKPSKYNHVILNHILDESKSFEHSG